MYSEITVEEMKALPENGYMLIDLRDEYAFSYGHIDGAVNIPQNVLDKNEAELPKQKKLIIYCMKGLISRDTAATIG
ncbi:MAG: rhodanese-like domain-containing protein [Porcipelethomonas sp.]